MEWPYVFGAQNKCHIETVLMSTDDVCSWFRNKKIEICNYPLLKFEFHFFQCNYSSQYCDVTRDGQTGEDVGECKGKYTVNDLKFQTLVKTAQTLMRLLLEKQSVQGLPCLLLGEAFYEFQSKVLLVERR